MSKAYLELEEMPKSCRDCKVCHSLNNQFGYFKVCGILKRNVTQYTQDKKGYELYPDCPLKPISTLDELREEINVDLLKHFREPELKCFFKPNHKRIVVYNGKGWEHKIEVGVTSRIYGLDDLPLTLSHKITTYFMGLEEENE